MSLYVSYKQSLTKANESSLRASEAHPTNNAKVSDTTLPPDVVFIVDMPLVQLFQVGPTGRA